MKAAAHPSGIESAREADRAAARAIKTLKAGGQHEAASDHYAAIVQRHQRRANRIALHYLRNAADADDAVQDAFIRAYVNLETYRDDLPFEVWFTRILVNGCLDRIKARNRRSRWIVPAAAEPAATPEPAAAQASPEASMLAAETRRQLAAALDQLPERQRLVFVLSQQQGYSSREVSAMTGMNESTVRVHLFRAIRKLRGLLRSTAGRHD